MAPRDNGEIRHRAERWQAETLKAQLAALGERKERFETDSGIPVLSHRPVCSQRCRASSGV